MKKFAIGCFGVLVIVAVAGGALTWFKVIKPGMEMASGFMELGEEFERLNDSVENQAAFQPPADGVLDAARLERFLAAQRQIQGSMEGQLDELKQKYEALDQRLESGDETAGIGDVFGAYADIGELLISGKRAQVEALNNHGFSLNEYAWVRDQAYRALGQSVAVASITNGAGQIQFDNEVAPETLALVEPYREELMQALALAWWGF
ncbi:MAG: hypothetical protein ACPGJE_03680 [Wenzhouxiangellaceae bacterium]